MSRTLTIVVALEDDPKTDPMTGEELAKYLGDALQVGGVIAGVVVTDDAYDPPGVKQLDMFGEVKP